MNETHAKCVNFTRSYAFVVSKSAFLPEKCRGIRYALNRPVMNPTR